MSTVSHWMHVDLFTVDQAAALWAGFDPARVSPFENMRPSELVAAGQMLLSAIVSGAIPADSSANALSCIGNFSRSFVARRDLEAFARKRQIYPAFLFDTLAPFGAGEGTLAVTPISLKSHNCRLLVPRLTVAEGPLNTTGIGSSSRSFVERIIPTVSRRSRPISSRTCSPGSARPTGKSQRKAP